MVNRKNFKATVEFKNLKLKILYVYKYCITS